jgi:hypothetical protein
LHRSHWRHASLLAATALIAATCSLTTASAQTPAPVATTPAPTEVATTGKPIVPNGTDNSATPGNNECYVRLFKPKDVPEQYKLEGAITVQYRARCSSPVTGYAIAFNRQVDSAETEIFPTYFSGNATTPDQSFNCAGDFPGIGVTCTGTYKGGFNTIRGLVTLDLTDKEVKNNTPFCKLKIAATATTFTSIISRDPYTNKPVAPNADGTSKLLHLAAGPFRVTTPACHRGAAKS